MTPILFEATETSFATNGLGRIPCISCVVKEERNGVYECTFVVSISEDIYPRITEGRIIYCIHDDAKDGQPFDIYARSAPMDGQVTFYAHHISYRLNKITVSPFTASTCGGALTAIGTNSINTNPFTFWTDKSVTATMKNTVPTTARALLAGQSGSVLDVYGKGEYKWDKWDVRLYTNRGTDKGVTIRYGKNLTDIKQDTDISQTYNAVAPYWTSGSDGTIVTLTAGMVVDTAHVVNNQIKCIPLDLSDEFEDTPTQQQLEAAATAHLAAASGWVMKTNLTVDFVALWQSPEYDQFAGLERVSLCDKVSVIHPDLGVAANKIEVISVEYDVLRERYTRMELGEPKNTFAEVIKIDTIKTVMSQVPSTDVMQEAIEHASDMITGAIGGCVVVNRDANGKPYELLILDTDNINTAVNVWRWNTGGLGHSHNGYSGPYNDVALTADGQINANMITTGVLRAIQIINGNGTFVANADGSVTASAINITGGSIRISTNTDSYDVIELSYTNPNNQYTTKAQLAPLQLSLDGYDADNNYATRSLRAQAGGTFLYYEGKRRASIGYNALFFNDDTEQIRSLLSSDNLIFYDSTGTTRSMHSLASFSLRDDTGQLRGDYSGNNIYYYNASGTQKMHLSPSSIGFYNDDGDHLSLYGTSVTFYADDGETLRATVSRSGSDLYDANGLLSSRYTTAGPIVYTDDGNDGRQARAYYYANGTYLYTSDGKYRAFYGYDGFALRDTSEKLRTSATSAGVYVRDASEVTIATLTTAGLTVNDSSAKKRAAYGQSSLSYYDTDGTTIKAYYSDTGLSLYGANNVIRHNMYKEGQAVRDANGTTRYLLQANMIQMFDDYSTERVRLGTDTFRLSDSTGTQRASVTIGTVGSLGFSYFRLYNSLGDITAMVTDTDIRFCDYYNASQVRSPSGVYGINAVSYYDTQHVNRLRLHVTDGLKFYNSSAIKVSEYAEAGMEIRDTTGSNVCAKITADGFDIKNASPYGVTVDGQGHSTALGSWGWKQFVSTDNKTCWIPCFIPN